MYKLLLPLLIFFQLTSFSQNQLNPVSWTITYVDKPNNEGEIIFKAKIDKNWHIYSQRPTDAGPIPTSFSVTPNANMALTGKVEEANAHEEYVKAFEAKVYVFEGEAVFTQNIKRKSKSSFTIATSLEYMTCNDMQCLPPKTIELTVTVPAQK